MYVFVGFHFCWKRHVAPFVVMLVISLCFYVRFLGVKRGITKENGKRKKTIEIRLKNIMVLERT